MEKKKLSGNYIEIRKNSIRFFNAESKKYTYNNLEKFLKWLGESMNGNPKKSHYFGSGIANKWAKPAEVKKVESTAPIEQTTEIMEVA